ncbi:DNA-binding protein [Parabacteroides sp. 52]|uniref:helix-turn-helix domain-containing protein n=1 Tax=unclassified Parabacteroides TaxID=2649774 RepID=UPI001EBD3FAA|nr:MULTISPECIES: helix-turn-helix domain-containing protein [unclassified Parabacteroides]NDV56057.1 DNA-binding protein [Parabacteroides sp. 52]
MIGEQGSTRRGFSTKEDIDETWVDGYEVCTFLRISERTLQRLRSNGQVSYSIISGKSYYQIKEIKRLLENRLIKSGSDCLDDLIKQHKQYNEVRRKNKP